ncbi:site-specific integrase [Pleurocapsales cyanobacterium LEGE 10410]|nr:site-specific integrase [Pleurocapsales cyanobacterium LEGE 10410]
MRHTFGTQVYAKSKDLRLVQDAMGHSDPRTTAKYAHVINETAAADFIEL